MTHIDCFTLLYSNNYHEEARELMIYSDLSRFFLILRCQVLKHTHTLTSNHEVSVWKGIFGLHECSCMTNVEHIKYSVSIHSHWLKGALFGFLICQLFVPSGWTCHFTRERGRVSQGRDMGLFTSLRVTNILAII